MRPPGAGRGRAGRPRGVRRRRWRRRRGGRRTAAGSAAVPSARTQAAYWGSTSPRTGAVEQRRGEQGGPVAGARDDLVDLGGRDPGGAVHRQPAGEHVVAERGEPLAAAEQPGGGVRVEATAGEVLRDEPGHRGRGGGLDGDRVRQVGRLRHREAVRTLPPTGRSTADGRRRGASHPQGTPRRDPGRRSSGSSGCRKPAARTAPGRRPDRPPRRTSRRPRRRPRGRRRGAPGTGPSGAARSRSRTRGGALAGVTALDASPRRLRCAM